MADERSTSPVFGDAGGTSPRDDDESTEEAAGAKRAAPAGGRAQSKKRGTTKTLRIGIIAGKVDDDCCVAPGIPESHWVSEAAARREEVHSEFCSNLVDRTKRCLIFENAHETSDRIIERGWAGGSAEAACILSGASSPS